MIGAWGYPQKLNLPPETLPRARLVQADRHHRGVALEILVRGENGQPVAMRHGTEEVIRVGALDALASGQVEKLRRQVKGRGKELLGIGVGGAGKELRCRAGLTNPGLCLTRAGIPDRRQDILGRRLGCDPWDIERGLG